MTRYIFPSHQSRVHQSPHLGHKKRERHKRLSHDIDISSIVRSRWLCLHYDLHYNINSSLFKIKIVSAIGYHLRFQRNHFDCYGFSQGYDSTDWAILSKILIPYPPGYKRLLAKHLSSIIFSAPIFQKWLGAYRTVTTYTTLLSSCIRYTII